MDSNFWVNRDFAWDDWTPEALLADQLECARLEDKHPVRAISSCYNPCESPAPVNRAADDHNRIVVYLAAIAPPPRDMPLSHWMLNAIKETVTLIMGEHVYFFDGYMRSLIKQVTSFRQVPCPDEGTPSLVVERTDSNRAEFKHYQCDVNVLDLCFGEMNGIIKEVTRRLVLALFTAIAREKRDMFDPPRTELFSRKHYYAIQNLRLCNSMTSAHITFSWMPLREISNKTNFY